MAVSRGSQATHLHYCKPRASIVQRKAGVRLLPLARCVRGNHGIAHLGSRCASSRRRCHSPAPSSRCSRARRCRTAHMQGGGWVAQWVLGDRLFAAQQGAQSSTSASCRAFDAHPTRCLPRPCPGSSPALPTAACAQTGPPNPRSKALTGPTSESATQPRTAPRPGRCRRRGSSRTCRPAPAR